MARNIFLADGWRLNLVWLLIGVFTVTSVFFLTTLGDAAPPRRTLQLLAGVSQLVMVPYLAWGLTHRRRPIVEIVNGVFRYCSLYWTGAGKTVELGDVASVRLNGTRLELSKREGKAVRFWLGDLSVQSREAVRSAIEEGIRACK